MKNLPVATGIFAFISPFPMFVLTILWSWFWFFGIGIGLLGLATFPDWLLILSLLPLFVSPALGVLGILHGIIKRTVKYAKLGILLSVLGLLENGILWLGMGYLSQF